jgi:predicted transcriptional regulator
MTQIERTLQKFGLTSNEIKVYLEVLKLDESSPFELAHLTGIPRTTVYDILMTLSLKGLVTLTQSDGFTKQQTRIRAKNPSTLRSILRQKQKDLTSLEIDVMDILPQLKNDFQKQDANADFQFYPGIDGAVKVMTNDYLKDVSLPVAAFENLMPMDSFGRHQMNQSVAQTTKHQLNQGTYFREIVPLTDWAKHVLTYQFLRDPDYLIARETRYVENPVFDLNQRITIQGNRICITCTKDAEAWGLVLNSPSLANTLRAIFEVIWQTARPVTPEFIRSLGNNQFLAAEKQKKVLK